MSGPLRVDILITRHTGETDRLTFTGPAEITIGRSARCQCRLESDPLVSRAHAALSIGPDAVRLRDLGSTNGILVNDMRLARRDGGDGVVVLRNGDSLRLGKTVMRVEFNAPPGVRDTGAESALMAAVPSVPGYAVRRLLGAGGMGEVYLAFRVKRGDLVALKVLTRGKGMNSKRVAAFNREIEVTKSVDHPNIVKFHDSGVADGGILYLALEYVPGGDLAAFINRHPAKRLPVRVAYDIMLQAVLGMAHAHANGIVHRDIKPQNILLAPDARGFAAKISDLGLAKNFEEAGFSLTPGTISGGGTMAYMPPEQLADFREVKPSADVFSLGASFYEMLTGLSPYNFSPDTDVAGVVAAADIVPIEERLPGLTEGLVVIIDRCLSREPEDRYRDSGELLAALANVTV